MEALVLQMSEMHVLRWSPMVLSNQEMDTEMIV